MIVIRYYSIQLMLQEIVSKLESCVDCKIQYHHNFFIANPAKTSLSSLVHRSKQYGSKFL